MRIQNINHFEVTPGLSLGNTSMRDGRRQVTGDDLNAPTYYVTADEAEMMSREWARIARQIREESA